EETSEPVISVYPNPVSQTQLLTVEVDAPARFQVITALGQPVGPAVQLAPNQPFRQPVDGLQGVYLLKFDIRGKTYSRKIVIR
ncbi:MAG TPA: T9SS type A sorting domain-containing protein, partial [Cyclobacteriaceae bacterium]|nr:T9SS type A sorting domain-containing protein [Cyclobacteriaceae bacterium]